MIVITGAAGFIASNLVAKLINEKYLDLILVDDFSKKEKTNNFTNKTCSQNIHRDNFPTWLDNNHKHVQFIFHLGARTDTTETNIHLLNTLNTEYTKTVWRKCCEYGIPLVYASSAATYGQGEQGFDDNSSPKLLKPLNQYGVSKNDFDLWALEQNNKPYFWAGIKFFNVYGPNEYHKGRMASVAYHAYNQIITTKSIKLFKSHNAAYDDGEQKRDFIYIKDVVEVLYYFLHHRSQSGIYNLGTGKARSFNDLANSIFSTLNIPSSINYIDTPLDIREKYQYFTEANISKLTQIGYSHNFYSLEQGIEDYINNYLIYNKYV